MRKTTIPVAVVLAASAVPMQAQEAANYTKESLSKSVGDLMQVINNYPTKVKNEYSVLLSEIQAKINGLDKNPTQEDLDKIAAEIQAVADKAAAEEKDYADARDAAKQAKTDAETAMSTADNDLQKLVVPSVKTSYKEKLGELTVPEMPSDDKLYNDKDLANSTKSAWGDYKSSIKSLVAEAQRADKAEQDAQPGRKTTLEDLVASVNAAAEAALPTIQGYWNYAEGDANAIAIQGVIDALRGISNQIKASLTVWELTEGKATTYTNTLNEKSGVVTASVAAAETAAKEAAQADADSKVSRLTPYEEPVTGNDDNIIAAKEDVNAAIASAKAKAKEVADALDKAPHESLAAELDKLVAAVAPAQAAVTAAQNNYDAYQSLVKTYNDLKEQYDKSAIDLSTLKANGKIDEQLYNDANGKLNVVAQNLQNLFGINEANYKDKKYEDGTSDEDYTAAEALLGDYTTVASIAQIVTDATNLNATLEAIKAYQTKVDPVVVTVTSDKYPKQAATLTSELTAQKATVTGLIVELENDFRANNALDSEKDAAVKAAITALEAAATKADDDMQAYEQSKETLAGWTNSVDSILGKIILDKNFETANKTAYDKLVNDSTLAETYKADLVALDSNVEGAFTITDEHKERSSQATLSIIKDKDYDTDLATLQNAVTADMEVYNTWLNQRGDEAAYKLGLQYVEDLTANLDSAIAVTDAHALGYAEDATAIKALGDSIGAKHTGEGHQFNDCIVALTTWKATSDSINTSILAHKQAWLDNDSVYNYKKGKLEEIKDLKLYGKLNDKTDVDSDIQKELNALAGKNGEQKAAEYDAATAVSTIKNSIAQKVLGQEITPAVYDAIEWATDSLGKTKWDPQSRYYSSLLQSYQSKADTLATNVTFEEYETKSKEIDTLIFNIRAVPVLAEANYTAYQSQKASQTAAKAEWAKINSSVGAKYGNVFAGAQALYQGQLNECFKVLTKYDSDIDKRYEEGTSVLFGTEAYNVAIAKNKEEMTKIEKTAIDNKDAYDTQVGRLPSLMSNYEKTDSILKKHLDGIQEAIKMADTDSNVTDEKKKELKQQEENLQGYIDALAAIKNTDISALDSTVKVKVNVGESVAYNKEYDATWKELNDSINSISDNAGGVYEQNIADHNAIIKQLFEAAYKDAKETYHEYVYSVGKYAGYTHALDENGNSAYADAIEVANQQLFTLNTKLVNEYDSAYVQFNKDGNNTYTDKKQVHKGSVNTYKAELTEVYNTFLQTTQAIEKDSLKAYMPLEDLYYSFRNKRWAVSRYTYMIDALKEFDNVDGSSLYNTYREERRNNRGPQTLDSLLVKVPSLTQDVNTAYNNAANIEASKHIAFAQDSIVAKYTAYTYPSNITALKDALETANTNIAKADSSRLEHYAKESLGDRLNDVLFYLKNYKDNTVLEAAKVLADDDLATRKESCEYIHTMYKGKIDAIRDSVRIIAESEFKDKLTALIDTANVKDSIAIAANDNAWNMLYQDGSEDSLKEAIQKAQDALDNLQDSYQQLVDNTPAGVVAILLKQTQALIPSYNRAEANAKGNSEAEAECNSIYSALTGLLTELQTTDSGKMQEIADDQSGYEKRINDLKERIIAADLEQKAYNELQTSLAEVKASLDGVKATIAASEEFKSDLESVFNATITEIENTLSAAEQNINIDHANNLCGKETATVKAADIETISASITSLSEDVAAEETALAKAKADAATRADNTTAYESAKDAIDDVKSALNTAWDNAQRDYSDVFTLFSDEVGEKDGKTGLYGQIASLYSSLETAYAAAQNEGGDPSVLNTENITSSISEITSSIEDLTTRISESQAQYVTDVETLNTNIEEMKASYEAVEISDIAAADEDVQEKKAAIDAAIDAIDADMENLGPNDIKDVQGKIYAANALIEELRELAAGKTYIPGDIDSDGKVDVLDLAVIRDLVSGKTDSSTLDENQQKAADMDADGEYTVADFVQVNNVYVYGNKLGQNKAVAKAAMKNQTEPGSVAMQMDTANMDVMLNSTVGYAAIQMDVTLPEGVSITEVEFSGESKSVMMTANMLDNGACRLMLYTVNSSNLLNGENRLLNLKLAGEGTGVVSIDRIIASTGAGQRHDLESVTGAYTIVTGIEAVEASEASKTSIFDINGMVRKTMQKGVNIVKDAAGKVKKILVK